MDQRTSRLTESNPFPYVYEASIQGTMEVDSIWYHPAPSLSARWYQTGVSTTSQTQHPNDHFNSDSIHSWCLTASQLRDGCGDFLLREWNTEVVMLSWVMRVDGLWDNCKILNGGLTVITHNAGKMLHLSLKLGWFHGEKGSSKAVRVDKEDLEKWFCSLSSLIKEPPWPSCSGTQACHSASTAWAVHHSFLAFTTASLVICSNAYTSSCADSLYYLAWKHWNTRAKHCFSS